MDGFVRGPAKRTNNRIVTHRSMRKAYSSIFMRLMRSSFTFSKERRSPSSKAIRACPKKVLLESASKVKERANTPSFQLVRFPTRYGRAHISSILFAGSTTRSKACNPGHFEVGVEVLSFVTRVDLVGELVAAAVAVAAGLAAVGLAVAEAPAASPTWEVQLTEVEECEYDWSVCAPEWASAGQTHTKLVVTTHG